MMFKPTDSRKITPQARQKALIAFDIPDAQPLAVGTEAEVYPYNETTLLKLYADTNNLYRFETLQQFYESLDLSKTNLSLPRIIAITPLDDLIVTLESRIDGVPLKQLLSNLDLKTHEYAENLYLDAVFQLKDIQILTAPETYLLFDPHAISSTQKQSFNSFYADLVEQKLQRINQYIASSYPSFSEKAAALLAAIRNGHTRRLSVVHGDFFPGNLLVDDALTRVYGVVDFGSFTLFGNYLLDIAGAFGFYRMYAPDRVAIRHQMLPKIMERLQNDEQVEFFQFLLANAILTSDLYALDPDPRADDHFQWALEIVSDDSYWSQSL